MHKPEELWIQKVAKGIEKDVLPLRQTNKRNSLYELSSKELPTYLWYSRHKEFMIRLKRPNYYDKLRGLCMLRIYELVNLGSKYKLSFTPPWNAYHCDGGGFILLCCNIGRPF